MEFLDRRLQQYDLIYVGTPYSKYEEGIDVAFIAACRLTAGLVTRGLKVYSPIAHTHPIAIHGGLDPLDHNIWLPFDEAIMAKSDAMLIGTLQGWSKSKGIDYEVERFDLAGKPIYTVDPETFEVRPYERYRR